MNYSKIARGALIAAAAAFLTALADSLPSIDFGIYTPVAFATFSAAINAVREYLKTIEA